MDEQPPTPSAPEPPPLERRGSVNALLVAGVVALIGLIIATFAFAAFESSDHEKASDQANPQIGDHWHASYSVYIGDDRQPNMPTWESGVHTHNDGIIHIHPFQEFEEGSGAALTKFFEYGGGVLTKSKIRIPGDSRTFSDGDKIPGENSSGHIYVASVAAPGSQRIEELGGGWALVEPTYIPWDGDRILIFFSTEERMRSLVASGGAIAPPAEVPTRTPSASVVLTP